MYYIRSLFRHMAPALTALLALSACESVSSDASQRVFSTPDAAVQALVTASRGNDRPAMLEILGPDAEKIVYSGDAVADRESHQKFVAAYDAYHSLETQAPNKQILVVGKEEWPMPIPVVAGDRGWVFDAKEGEQKIIDRRIGRNELAAIEICRAYVEAQRDYADMHHKSHHGPVYAQRITSSHGKYDGLYWPTSPHQVMSPLGPLMADAQAEGYATIPTRHPFHGYFFRILTKQGADAAGGARDYVVNGHMTKGFALIAIPAIYDDSGIKSFIVNQNGFVYEKDLGSDTAKLAAQIDSFNPDDGWDLTR